MVTIGPLQRVWMGRYDEAWSYSIGHVVLWDICFFQFNRSYGWTNIGRYYTGVTLDDNLKKHNIIKPS